MKPQFGWRCANKRSLPLFAGCALGLAFAQSVNAQNHPDRPPQRQQAPAPRPQSQPLPRSSGGGQNPNRRPANSGPRQDAAPHQPVRSYPPSGGRATERQPNYGPNRPPTSTGVPAQPRTNNFNYRPNEMSRDRPAYQNNRPYENGNGAATLRPRQQVGVGSPQPFVDRMRDLNPQQRDRVLQSSRAFQNLAPDQQSRIRQQFAQWDHLSAQQRADLRAKEDTWRRMTPDQRAYVKNDVLPRWRQIPWERQQVIEQKLGVLQNMPESARNRRLGDPNFTRGMSDEDRQTLHDLSHLHVGGVPDPPGE